MYWLYIDRVPEENIQLLTNNLVQTVSTFREDLLRRITTTQPVEMTLLRCCYELINDIKLIDTVYDIACSDPPSLFQHVCVLL